MATTASKASKTGVADAVLNGRIEAIGVQNLLRVAISRPSTGRLCLCNEETTADLFFRQGRLIQLRWDKTESAKPLSGVLDITYGEFEFVRSEEPLEGAGDASLHQALMTLISDGSGDAEGEETTFSELPPRMRVSGVHRVAQPNRSHESARLSHPPASQEQASSFLQRSLLPQETGRAIVNRNGVVLEQAGRVSTRDANCIAALCALSFDLASVFGTSRLERIEVRQPEGRSLFGRMTREGLRLSVIEQDEAAEQNVWRELEL